MFEIFITSQRQLSTTVLFVIKKKKTYKINSVYRSWGQNERTYGKRPDLDSVQYLGYFLFLSQIFFYHFHFLTFSHLFYLTVEIENRFFQLSISIIESYCIISIPKVSSSLSIIHVLVCYRFPTKHLD